MTSSCNCTDQQIIHWHYRTFCRYQLTGMPLALGIPVFVKKITAKIPSSNVLEFKKVEGQSLTRKNINAYPNNPQMFFNQDNQKTALSVSNYSKRRFGYVNHVKFWKQINTITLHMTSGKLLSSIELFPSFYMAQCCFGNQGPQIIRSKRAVAEFGVVKGAIIGTQSHLHKQKKYNFLYKWLFIAAGLSPTEDFTSKLGFAPKAKHPVSSAQCFGVNNVFIFPELDKYNYYLFEPIGGFDLTFIKTNLPKKPYFRLR